jgi:hypothetical protein
MALKAEQRLDVVDLELVDGRLSRDDLAELRARSARADDVYARGECVSADVVLADLDEMLSGA